MSTDDIKKDGQENQAQQGNAEQGPIIIMGVVKQGDNLSIHINPAFAVPMLCYAFKLLEVQFTGMFMAKVAAGNEANKERIVKPGDNGFMAGVKNMLNKKR